MGDFVRGLCYWLSSLEQSQDQITEFKEAHPNLYREIKYEELVRSPGRVLNDIAVFLDVAPSEQTASVLSTIQNRMADDPPVYHIARVPEREMERIMKIMNAFSYPTVGLGQ